MVGVGVHDHLENTHVWRVRMYSGDVVAGAFGNRYTTDYYERYLPTGTMAHLAGGAPELLSSAVGPA